MEKDQVVELFSKSYTVGLQFASRSKELQANEQLRSLQQQAVDFIQNNDVVDIAIEKLHEGNRWKGTTGAAKLASEVHIRYPGEKARGNLHQHSCLLALNSGQGVISLEKKISSFLEMLQEDLSQAISWVVFGRCPYTEYRLSSYLKIKREYALKQIRSARRVIDPKLPSYGLEFEALQTSQLLPKLSQQQIQDALKELIKLKTQEFGNDCSSKQQAFMNKLLLMQKHQYIVSFLLETWITQYSNKARWSTLKSVAKLLPDLLGERKNLRLFSAFRSLLVFALSPIIEETVCKLMKTVVPLDALSKPFVKKNLKLPPLSLVMGSKFVIQRPGNAEKLSKLATTLQYFDIIFPRIGGRRTSIVARIRFHQKLLHYLNQGASIKLLSLHAGDAPSYKIRCTIAFEGPEHAFMSTEKVKLFAKQIKAIKTSENILGIDINRLGPDILSFSEDVELPHLLLKLCQRYNNINAAIADFSPSLTKALEKYYINKVIKRRGEIQRMYSRRANLLKEIHNLCSQFTSAVLVKGKFAALANEELELSTRNTRGALAKAITTMPDDDNLYIHAVKTAEHLLKYTVGLISVDPRGTSSTHYICGGSIKRIKENWDIGKCIKCEILVNSHKNAAYNVREEGKKKFNFPVRIPGTSIN